MNFSFSFLSALLLSSLAPLCAAPTMTTVWMSPKSLAVGEERKLSFLLKSPDLANLEKSLINNSAKELSLLQWGFINSVKEPALQGIAKDSFGRAFLTALYTDKDWLEGFLYSGPNPKSALALEYLLSLVTEDKQIVKNPVLQKLATAIAIEFARNDWSLEEAKERYNFYASSWREKLLNKQFDTLDFWDMRIIGGCKREGVGSVKSLKWSRDNVRLPAPEYVHSCWQAPYRLNNISGDSIHGHDYYWPFAEHFDNRMAEMTKFVGGVCGGLSHYGAFAALANGVPALTMGEPGHCAYTVRTSSTHWEPAYSLSWKRGAHWNFWGREQWSFLILTQEIYSQKDSMRVASSYDTLAKFAISKGNNKAALNAYAHALKTQPLNYPIWLNYLELAKKMNPGNKTLWLDVHKNIIAAFGEKYPEIAFSLISQELYPMFMDMIKSPAERTALIIQFYKSVDKMLPVRWNIEDALDQQLKYIEDGTAILPFYSTLIKETITKSDYSSPIIAWGQSKVEASPELEKPIVAATIAAMESGNLQGDALKQLCAQALLAAEKNKDLTSFQSIGKLTKPLLNTKLPAYEKFPGELLSIGGMICPSSTSSYDKPEQHWGILEPEGGFLHTSGEDNASVTVELKNMVDINGIVIISWERFIERMGNLIIETSIDGTAWEKAHQFSGAAHVQRADFQKAPKRARFLKITRPGNDFFHLEGIHVYGKKAS